MQHKQMHIYMSLVLLAALPAWATSPIEEAVDAVMAAKKIGPMSGPGCAVSVTKQNQSVFSKAYGSADLEHGVTFTPATISETGSVSKQFTAAAIFLLAEDGKLSLDDDIRIHLPEMPDYGTPIRIRDLIHQTSGIREWSTLAGLRGYPRFYRKFYTLDDLFKLVAAQRTLNFKPGTRFEYSNSNYGLLTVIIERAGRMPAAEFARVRMFAQLGMNDTQWRTDARKIVPGRAVAYRPTPQGYEQYMPREEVYGHGAALTTVADLQIWNQAVHGGVAPAITERLLSPGVLTNGEKRPYGGGIIVTEYRGHKLARHGGNTAGYTAQLWAFPEKNISIAVLCNVAGSNIDIVTHAADAALGLPPETKPVPVTTPTPVPNGPTAYYQSAEGEVLALRKAGRKTYIDLFTRTGFMELIPGSAKGTWTTARYPGGLKVKLEKADTVISAMDDREPSVYKRLATAPATLDSLVGRYTNADLRAVYEIGADNIMRLVDTDADDPISFKLERLTGDVYLARLDTKSGYIRDDFTVAFDATGFKLSSVAGYQAVDGLAFTKTD
ncbi:MAG: beta-lactamase family protein [Rhodospirillaceae bacterium]|nr:beta-lactamase family protein [Rhodospirillaceae bacterium]